MSGAPTFQERVHHWMLECFDETIAADGLERCDRFLEEALELVQAARPDYTAERMNRLVAYVMGRPAGELHQEVGGVAVTLAAFCNALNVNVLAAQEIELARCWRKLDTIKAKHARKAAAGVSGPEPEPQRARPLVPCPACDGTGIEPGMGRVTRTCGFCGGDGVVPGPYAELENNGAN